MPELTEELIRRVIREELGIRPKYLPIEGTVVKGSPVTIEVREKLGYNGRHGFIVPEGNLQISINGVRPFTPFRSGETIDLRNLDIERIDIITDSSTPVRFRGWVV